VSERRPPTRLGRITSPDDLKALSPAELAELSAEIREFLVQQVSKRGGHLGPNLGVVELTLALHRVFHSPSDPIVFDTGHQAYVHKIVTGRADQFDRLRTRGGLSGYPNRAESPHDWVENSHASTSLSYADGLAKAFALRGQSDRTVVAVVGDGALTGGMAWEALNNIAAGHDRPLVIVLNDNGRSYAPTAGGMAQRMAAMRLRPGYERLLGQVKETLPRAPVVGRPLYSALHAAKTAVKDWLLPQTMFADLGLKYLGPVDGHDIAALEVALRRARDFRGPVLVHCVTRKGQGYHPAESDDAEQMHSPPAFPPRGHTFSDGRWCWPARNARTWSRSPRRCAGRPAWCRSRPRSRTGCSTSGSPNSTPSPLRPAWPWAACTPSSPSMPPSSTGHSTNC